MSSFAVLGCAWGDEAKAKMIDLTASDADIVVRFQGGANAGHTIYHNNNKYVLHLIPSGVFYPQKICVLGNGMVIDPFALLEEFDMLLDAGVELKDRLFIDPGAHLVLPIHKQRDCASEDNSIKKIGTTRRGIGPAYADKANRIGVRVGDLLYSDYLLERLQNLYASLQMPMPDDLLPSLQEAAKRITPCIKPIPLYLENAYKQGKTILLEGAQGTLLDIGFGNYPYVTSSPTLAGGACVGSGLSPKRIDRVLGVYKSYYTRVGEGPFPTEQDNAIGEQIRKQGNEYGSSTGRPRRCGWFDSVAARWSAMLNGVDEMALTLVDVLSGLPELKICTGYLVDGTLTTDFPWDMEQLADIQPQYLSMPAWSEDISGITLFDDLPEAAKNYLRKVEELVGVQLKIVSVGPRREQTIFM